MGVLIQHTNDRFCHKQWRLLYREIITELYIEWILLRNADGKWYSIITVIDITYCGELGARGPVCACVSWFSFEPWFLHLPLIFCQESFVLQHNTRDWEKEKEMWHVQRVAERGSRGWTEKGGKVTSYEGESSGERTQTWEEREGIKDTKKERSKKWQTWSTKKEEGGNERMLLIAGVVQCMWLSVCGRMSALMLEVKA